MVATYVGFRAISRRHRRHAATDFFRLAAAVEKILLSQVRRLAKKCVQPADNIKHNRRLGRTVAFVMNFIIPPNEVKPQYFSICLRCLAVRFSSVLQT